MMTPYARSNFFGDGTKSAAKLQFPTAEEALAYLNKLNLNTLSKGRRPLVEYCQATYNALKDLKRQLPIDLTAKNNDNHPLTKAHYHFTYFIKSLAQMISEPSASARLVELSKDKSKIDADIEKALGLLPAKSKHAKELAF